MKAEIVLIEKLNNVAYYTVEVIDSNGTTRKSEFSDFKARMKLSSDPKDSRQLGVIEAILNKMGSKYGATENNFRREDSFEAIPSHEDKFWDSTSDDDQGLRLYCIRVNDEIVILLNGGRKTNQRVLDCPNCRDHFLFAREVAMQFYDALRSGEIEVQGKDLLIDENYFLNV